MFSLFKKKEKSTVKKKAGKTGPKYVYKPNENVLAFRIDYREEQIWVYSGWSKNPLFKIEEGKIYSAADEKLSYIIIGRDIYDAEGVKLMFRVSGSLVYAANSKNPLYELQDSIRVQGTI